MISQGVGLAQGVGLPCEAKTLHPQAPWRWLPGHWAAKLGVLSGLDPKDGIAPPWPDLLITCGGRPVAVALAIKRASHGHTFTVHIQDPRVPPGGFDMVVPPEHDGLTGPNIYPSKGALHRLTRETLATAAERFRKTFAAVHKPFVAVLIGGKSKAYNFTTSRMRELATQLKSLIADHGAGLVITTSRRTGAEKEAILREALADTNAIIWDGTGENPYQAMLALADVIIVTEDSASMVSEACFTGKPVYVARLDGGSKRFDELHKSLQGAGFTRPFSGELETWEYLPLDESHRIGAIVREKLASYLAAHSRNT
ncbi:MAG: mitochondrial fission ELM1 family protein [Thiobacillaceae bacterium]